MAGSAGSPPRVYVCPNPKCRMVTVIPADELPKRFAGSLCYGSPRNNRRHDPGMKVEYVPREQSDALFAALNEVVEMTGLLLPARGEDAALDAMGDRVAAVLDSYREATAGEGDPITRDAERRDGSRIGKDSAMREMWGD